VRINNNLLLCSSVSDPSIVSTLSRLACAIGGIWVNSSEGPELALCDWQLFSAMQNTSSSDRCKKTPDQQSQFHVTPQ
jgi:hypothetical protein